MQQLKVKLIKSCIAKVKFQVNGTGGTSKEVTFFGNELETFLKNVECSDMAEKLLNLQQLKLCYKWTSATVLS